MWGSSHPYSEKINYIILSELTLNTGDTEAHFLKFQPLVNNFLLDHIIYHKMHVSITFHLILRKNSFVGSESSYLTIYGDLIVYLMKAYDSNIPFTFYNCLSSIYLPPTVPRPFSFFETSCALSKNNSVSFLYKFKLRDFTVYVTDPLPIL